MTPKYYIVGGYVRDKLLGVKSKDVDYAVECDSFEAMVADVESKGGQIFLSKPEFLTIRAKVPHHEDAADYVLCRKESFYSDGRRPDSVTIGTIYDDLARRDFTINAIAICEDGSILDPYNGESDARRGILRCVGDTGERLREDGLRLLRAMRFQITKGFYLSHELDAAFRDVEFINGACNVSRERIFEELRRCYEFDSGLTMNFLDHYPLLKIRLFLHPDGPQLKLSPRL